VQEEKRGEGKCKGREKKKGALCKEFLSSHLYIARQVVPISRGNELRSLRKNISPKAQQKEGWGNHWGKK